MGKRCHVVDSRKALATEETSSNMDRFESRTFPREILICDRLLSKINKGISGECEQRRAEIVALLET